MIRFVLALVVWLFVGVLVAAEADAQTPPDYSLVAGYGVLFLAWIVSYWIRARNRTGRRWWWIGGVPELLLTVFEHRRARAARGEKPAPVSVEPPTAP